MNLIKQIKRYFPIMRRFFPQWCLYGFSVAFWSLLFPFHHIFGFLRPFLGIKKHRAILSYLSNRYIEVIEKFSNAAPKPEINIDPASPIWVCWWDGEEAMPDIVKICSKTIKQHTGGHPVNLITKDNYKKYVSFPDYIMEKVNTKIITLTHFSNMLRANILFEYGGIWMDATILTLNDISFDNLPFFTLKAPAKKNNSVSMARFTGLSDMSTTYHYSNLSPKISRWSGFLLAGTKGSIIFEYMRDILYAYWKDHNDQIDYVLYDYTIALGFDNIPLMRKMIEDVPCNETEKFVLERNLNNEYNEENFAMYPKTTFHKLTWKDNFKIRTKDNKLTIYGHLLEKNAGC